VRRTFLGLPGLQQLGLGLAADAIGLEDLMDFAPDLQHGVLSGVVIPGRTQKGPASETVGEKCGKSR